MSAGHELSAGASHDWESIARGAGRGASEPDAPELLRELLVFHLDGTPYALPVARVREIVRVPAITPVPRVPPEIRGVIALRGEIVQILDLRMRIGLEAAQPTRKTRIIVLHDDDDRVTGVLVDEVSEVVRVPEPDLRASSGEGELVSELFARGEDFVSVIELDRVLEVSFAD